MPKKIKPMVNFNVRLAPELYEQLDTCCRQTKITKTDIVANALKHYLKEQVMAELYRDLEEAEKESVVPFSEARLIIKEKLHERLHGPV
ncbi:MAG TPA: ribbon-helix-helix domain-containing protein [Methylomusa anaerophila]|uniref:Ribbon-helix-helix domain protein n=1 Tax=Methylomusa anaerophila TaxID=1930071 RepID=A0A348AGK1_9FIRM|nr:ribbon-helix-helix domain-containing protein [Methylomusa anaerophila]BBB90199.1 ribbon-helix-helix domain protein [Methylomusa anaerophila]HML88074.1 ribbon-helix-helix domain-containing protein [Methylomusa anaerophila]